MLRVMGSLRGLRAQLLIWTVLPLTLALVTVALLGINTHQRSMRRLVEELDARSARLAAAQLSDKLEERVGLLELILTGRPLAQHDSLDRLFDGGLAHFNASGELLEAFPSTEAWRSRPTFELLAGANPTGGAQHSRPAFSPLFFDPLTGRASLLIALASETGETLVGAVSLERLGLTEIVAEVQATDGIQSPITARRLPSWWIQADESSTTLTRIRSGKT